MVRFAMARVSVESPLLYAGCPQQVWAAGTPTAQPASSSSLTAANPTEGRKRSARQVTKSPTHGRVATSPGELEVASDTIRRTGGGRRQRWSGSGDIGQPPAPRQVVAGPLATTASHSSPRTARADTVAALSPSPA